MRQTCDKVGGVNYHNGRNLYTGFGRINAEKAVLAARTPGPSVPDGTLVAALAQGRQRLTLHGQPGQTYRIESSDNLVDWAGIRTVILISNEFTLEPYLSPDFQHRFYRAVLQSEGIADGK